MAKTIDTLTKRKKLTPRREPYWHKIGKGCFLGFRKIKDGHGTWIGRTQKGQKKKYTSLGSESQLTFEGASSKLLKWFKSNPFEKPPTKPTIRKYTIRDAVNDYIAHLKIHKSEDSAYRTEKQLHKHLIPILGATHLKDLKLIELKKWRDSLLNPSNDTGKKLAKSTVNRILTSAKASFNLALENEHIQSDSGWKRADAYASAGNKRNLLLSDKQVSLLVKKSKGDLQQLIKAHILTGTRPGELSQTTVNDFDKENATLSVDGKTGSREVYLQDSAISFISEIVQKKKKSDLIFTNENVMWTKHAWADQLNEVIDKNSLTQNSDKNSLTTDTEDDYLPDETVMYSIRHYHISKAITAGLPLQIVAENCGTSVKMIEKHYGKFTSDERLKMFNKVSLIKS